MDNTKSILQNVKSTLTSAKFGLIDLSNKIPTRRESGLRNFVTFSRSVTFVLQKLRGVEENFDDWYRPYQNDMASNTLFKYFVELRNKILKEGDTNTSVEVNINSFDARIIQFLPKPPLPIKGFFMGDRLGGNGWIVETTDGSEEHYYIDLPTEVGTSQLVFNNLPDNIEVDDKSIINLCTIYYNFLDEMVKDAYKRFG